MQPPRTAAALILAVVMPLMGGSASAQPPTTPPATDALARLDRVIADRTDASGVPGFAVAVVSGDRVVHVRGFGDADASGRPVTGDTPFVTGSSGKAFTALALMQLVDAGKVDLDAPVRRYVPELRLADRADADRILVRHVVQHTSGLRAGAIGPVLASAADGSALDAIAEIRDEKPVTRPGQTWDYANVNYVLAGLIIERASGERFAQYMQRRVFGPLGMRRTFTSLAEGRAAGLASGARYWFGVTRWHGPTFRRGVQAAGYYISTANDLARFLRAFLNQGVVDGRRVISQRGLQSLMTPGPDAHLGPWADGASARYAMGWFAGGPWRERVYFHPGNTPDSSSMIAFMPERGWAVASMTNISNELPVPGNPAVPDRLARNVIDVLLDEPITGVSAHRFYAIFDLVALGILALLAWSLTRAAFAVRRATPTPHRIRSAAAVPIRALAGILIAFAPGLASAGWASSSLWSPDLTLTLVVFGSLLLITAMLRAAWLVRSKRHVQLPALDLRAEPLRLAPERERAEQ